MVFLILGKIVLLLALGVESNAKIRVSDTFFFVFKLPSSLPIVVNYCH